MIEIHDLGLSFTDSSGHLLSVLRDVNLNLPSKGFCFLLGKSGSGKTSLLHCLGGLLPPTTGTISMDGQELNYRDSSSLLKYRKEKVAFVFQDYNLLSDFSVLDNLCIAGNLDIKEAESILSDVGLGGKEKTKVRLLSGGEQQRLAIGRALAKQSPIFLLDEPTANLDEENAKIVFDLLKNISKTRLVFVATHDEESSYHYGDFVYEIQNGSIEKVDSFQGNATVFNPFDPKSFEFLSFCMKLEKGGQKQISYSCDNGERSSIPLEEGQIYSKLVDSLSSFEGRKITFYGVEEKEDKTTLAMSEARQASFPFKRQWAYSRSLLKSHKGRAIASTICFSLASALLFVQSSMIFLDESGANYRALQASYMDLVPVSLVEENTNLLEKTQIDRGPYLHDQLISQGYEEPIVSFEGTMQSINHPDLEITARVYVVDRPFYFSKNTWKVPDLNECFISLFSAEYLELSLGKFHLKIGNYSHEIDSVQTFDNNNLYSRELFKRYRAGQLKSSDLDEVNYFRTAVFISRETYNADFAGDEFFAGGPIIPSSNGDFGHSYYLNTPYTSPTVGRNPSAKNEIAISKGYFYGHEPEDWNSWLGKEVNLPDFEASPNAVSYRNEWNPVEMGKTFVITGFYDQLDSCCVISDEVYQVGKRRSFFADANGLYVTVKEKSDVKALLNKNFVIAAPYTSSLNQCMEAFSQNFSIVFYITETILGLIATLLLLVTCSVNVREKKREIAILESLGIEKRQALSPFWILNSFQALLGLGIGFVLSFIGIYGIDTALIRTSWLNLRYNLFAFAPLSIPIVVLLTAVAVFVATIIPLVRSKKTSLSVVLRTL